MQCLYNGVKLPALPENIHENAYISYFKGSSIVPSHYSLWFTAEPHYDYSVGGKYCIGYKAGSVRYRVLEPIIEESVWENGTEYENDGVATELENVKWANFDVLNEDGTLYLAASDPVPVSPVLNPAAMMQCFLVGQALRRNRT